MESNQPQPRFLNYNLVFLVVVLILLFLAVLSFQRFNQQKESAFLVNQSFHVKLNIEEAYGLLRDAEAAQRAFIITRDTSLLLQVRTARSALQHVVDRLDSLINEPEQRRNLDVYQKLIGERMIQMGVVLDSIAGGRDVNYSDLLRPGLDHSERVTKQIREMMSHEDQILAERISVREAEETRASMFILLLSLFSLMMLVISFFRIRREVSARTLQEFTSRYLEAKVKERTADLMALNQRLNEQNIQLEKKNQELNSFTYIASHDLKEPLRKITIFAQLISDSESLSENGKRFFCRIQDSVRRMQDLINSIFSYAQTETGPQLAKVNLAETARKAISELDDLVRAKHATIAIDDLPIVYAIPQQMDQMLENLIGNALKYSRPGAPPMIRIHAEPCSSDGRDGWKVHVSDNGIGFEEEFKESIFEIFKRLHSGDEVAGTGIGLAICRKVAQNHSGWITATSRLGEGSTFTFFIPEKQAS